MKILCLGNSITHHAPAPDIGWHGDYGMAASDMAHDYVHRLSDLLANASICNEIYDANIADFERGCDAYDFSKFDGFLGIKPDILVLRISENVPQEKIAAFGEAYRRLIRAFQEIQTPHILAVGGFWNHAEKEEQIISAASDCGVTYVSLSGLDEDKYKAIGLFEHAGVAGHPGDLGMEEIAKRIRDVILDLLSK